MLLTIRVKPASELRVAFAKWAVAQTPKINKCSHAEFCVPPQQFTEAPEELLIGAIVDGHRYVSPLEDEQLAAAAREREQTQAAPTADDAAPQGFVCEVCGRPFPTERGRNTHRRQAHPEGDS